jgi:DtxR family Mn-dependent transcriptional regulator
MAVLGSLVVMTAHDHITTEAEEMYLITIARAVEDGTEPPVAVSEIARVLGVSGVSANQMVKKLETLGLVDYTPYKGVALTDKGGALSRTVLRNRRLWGLFLSDHLGLTPERADEVACEMEHITPDFVADRLSEFLGNPPFGPTGKPIPGRSDSDVVATTRLVDAPTGLALTVHSVAAPFDAFLEAQGAGRGATVTVLATGADGSVMIESRSGTVHLGADAASAVAVVGES